MKGIQVRKGAILLWRLGSLTHGEQSSWDRAPMRKGMWAFPWPFYAPSFTAHQYTYYLPKRLSANRHGAPLDPSWFRYPDGSKAEGPVELDEYGWPLDINLNESQDFYDEQKDWIKRVGRRRLPLRKFWYEGDLFTHFPRTGYSGDEGGLDCETLSSWHRVSSDEAARRLRKGSGQLVMNKPDQTRVQRRGYTVGALELFLPPGPGRIS